MWAAGLLLLAWAGPLRAQGVAVEARVGVAALTPLVRDAIASSVLVDSLLPPGREVAAASVAVVPSPVVTLVFRQERRRPVVLEAELGWTFGRVRAGGGAGGYSLGTVGVAQAAVAARWQARARVHASAGAGVLSYRGWSRGVFRGAPSYEPMLEAGAGLRLPAGDSRLTLELTVQGHPFHTAALADAGERSGGVLRGLLQAGILLGGGR